MKLQALLRALVLLVLGSNLAATWSIIIVDTRTGEIAIGSATCVRGWDLRSLTAVLVIGKGGACAQSYVDMSGNNRLAIFNGFKKGTSPKDILAALAKSDSGHETRQYGMVDTRGRAIGFSGKNANDWKGHVTGSIGTLVYAVQGNILTGAKVVTDAVTALRTTRGDLAAKMMAAMEAARKMGGDGRCSCLTGTPTSCGTPPKSFKKTADIGFMMIGRLGDKDGTCGGGGCATGSYYMNLNVITSGFGPDPVLTLKTMHDKWRAALRGRPDHHLSTFTIPSGSLPADGATSTVARLVLRDIDGKQMTAGGAKVTVRVAPASTGALTIGAVKDHGDGTYSVPLKAGSKSGTVKLEVVVNDGTSDVRIGPDPVLGVTNNKLWVSNTSLPIQTGGTLEFVINQGAANKDRIYMLLASNSGTKPGFAINTTQRIPLNVDPVFWSVFWLSGTSAFPNFLGRLDSQGRKTIRLQLPKGIYSLPAQSELSFATALFYPLDSISNPVDVRLAR